MIAHIHGEVADKTLKSLIVDVSGVGYELLCPASTIDATRLNETMKFYTYHHVREQAQELYGFETPGGKDLFQLLITVNGIGPKAGLAIMSLGDETNIRSAIASGDVAFITSASGVGKKGAEKVVLDLKDKVGGIVATGSSVQSPQPVARDDALEALLALGYNKPQAEQALSRVDQSLDPEEKIRQALKEI